MQKPLFATPRIPKRKNTLVDIQSKSRNYRGLDKYYTKEEVAVSCLKLLSLDDYDLVVEPSAGNGAFYNNISHPNKIGLDIEPEHPEVITQDWLAYKVSSEYGKVLIVGNPPFGVNNNLSAMFLEHAFRFENVRTVAFILPNVYNKHTRQKIIPSGWRIKVSRPLPKDCFIFEGGDKHLPCSFFVFDRSRGRDLRFLPERYRETEDFAFGDKNDFDIFVFGASPAKVVTDPEDNNRGYFLKSKIPVKDLVKNFQTIKWEGNSCANGGVYWLTKAELCYFYTRAMNR